MTNMEPVYICMCIFAGFGGMLFEGTFLATYKSCGMPFCLKGGQINPFSPSSAWLSVHWAHGPFTALAYHVQNVALLHLARKTILCHHIRYKRDKLN